MRVWLTTLLTLNLLACGGTQRARPTDRIEELAYTEVSAPWDEAGISAECGGTLYHATDAGVFASLDGATWRRDAVPEPVHIVIVQCFEGELWGLGIPAAVARRTSAGEWTVEHHLDVDPGDMPNPPPHLNRLHRPDAGGPMRAWGWGLGERIALERSADGSWRRIAVYDSPTDPRPECEARPLRDRLRDGDVVSRARVCPGHRLLLFTDEGEQRPSAVVRLPPSLRLPRIVVRAVVDGTVVLTGASRFFELSDEPSHHVVATYRDGRWAAAELEEYSWEGGTVTRDGRVAFFGFRKVYWFRLPRVRGEEGELP